MDLKQANIFYFVLKPLYKKSIRVEWNKRLATGWFIPGPLEDDSV